MQLIVQMVNGIYIQKNVLSTPKILIIIINTIIINRQEISVTLSDSFLITIPIDKKKEDDDCEEEIPQCVSGDTFSGATNPSGCEVKKQNLVVSTQ